MRRKTFPDKKQGASPEGGTSIEKTHRSPQGGINNNYSLEMRIQQQQQQQQQQSFYPNAQCSHQCQGFHATPANTPTLWGGSASSTKYPNDSSRPPTPSFPPYDVRTLHFVACGRPWLLHWRMGTGRRDDARMCPAWYFFSKGHRRSSRNSQSSWSHFWGKFGPHGIICKGLWPLAGARRR